MCNPMSNELDHVLKNLSKKDSKSVALVVKKFCKERNLNISDYIVQITQNSAELLTENLPEELVTEIYKLIDS